MRCPKCGEKTWVTNTETRKLTNCVVRIRECVSCGYRFTTTEVEATKGYKEARSVIRKVADLVRDFE